MHDCQDDNLMVIDTIEDTVRESLYQPAADRWPNDPATVGIFGQALCRAPDFSEESTAKTIRLPLVKIRCFKHFLLSIAEKDDTCHLSRLSASSKTCSAGLLTLPPARYS